MTLALSPEDAAFREEVRAFLAEKLTPALRRAGERMTSVYADHDAQMAWQALRMEAWSPAQDHRHGASAVAWRSS